MVFWHSVVDLELRASRSDVCNVVEDIYIYMSYICQEMPAVAILFFRMRLISFPEKLMPNEDILQILEH